MAHAQGDTLGAVFVCEAHVNGEQPVQNDTKAVSWFRRAANQGHALGQYYLATMYAEGRGVKRNDARSLFWIRRAAAQGFPEAEGNLSSRYEYGRGVVRDPVRALSWELRAARHGDPGSQASLGQRYKRGLGVKRNNAKALFWYLEAKSRGDYEAGMEAEQLCWDNKTLCHLPEAMHGTWGLETPSCANPDNKFHLIVDERFVGFYASSHHITSVTMRRDGSIRARSMVGKEGETGRSESKVDLRLLGKDRLRVDTGTGASVYLRCP
jgi:hypothetical protein